MEYGVAGAEEILADFGKTESHDLCGNKGGQGDIDRRLIGVDRTDQMKMKNVVIEEKVPVTDDLQIQGEGHGKTTIVPKGDADGVDADPKDRKDAVIGSFQMDR